MKLPVKGIAEFLLVPPVVLLSSGKDHVSSLSRLWCDCDNRRGVGFFLRMYLL